MLTVFKFVCRIVLCSMCTPHLKIIFGTANILNCENINEYEIFPQGYVRVY